MAILDQWAEFSGYFCCMDLLAVSSPIFIEHFGFRTLFCIHFFFYRLLTLSFQIIFVHCILYASIYITNIRLKGSLIKTSLGWYFTIILEYYTCIGDITMRLYVVHTF